MPSDDTSPLPPPPGAGRPTPSAPGQSTRRITPVQGMPTGSDDTQVLPAPGQRGHDDLPQYDDGLPGRQQTPPQPFPARPPAGEPLYGAAPHGQAAPGPRSREDVMPGARRPALAEAGGRDVWGGAVWMLLLSLLLGVGTGYAALRVDAGVRLDKRLLKAFGDEGQAWSRIHDGLTMVSFGGIAVCLAACVGAALLRRNIAAAVGAAVVVGGANVTTQVLKKGVLERLDGRLNSLPSGHTTVALSLGLAAVIVAPAAWRWVVVPVAGFAATFVGAGTVVGQWHRPADVVTAYCVCLVWTAIALLVVRAMHGWTPAPRRAHGRMLLALLACALVGLLFVAWGVRPTDHDVNLVLAASTLGAIGVLCALAVAWTASLCDRFQA